MVRITNNKDKNLRYVVSGSATESSKFNDIIERLKCFGWKAHIIFGFNGRLIATYKFRDNWEKNHFRDRYDLERQVMREEKNQLTA